MSTSQGNPFWTSGCLSHKKWKRLTFCSVRCPLLQLPLLVLAGVAVLGVEASASRGARESGRRENRRGPVPPGLLGGNLRELSGSLRSQRFGTQPFLGALKLMNWNPRGSLIQGFVVFPARKRASGFLQAKVRHGDPWPPPPSCFGIACPPVS